MFHLVVWIIVAVNLKIDGSVLFIFLSGFSFTDNDNLQDSGGREGTIFYSTLPLPPTHKHSNIYLQLCMWDDYHFFNCTTCIYQTATQWDLPPYWITFWLVDDAVLIVVCLLDDLILSFCYRDLSWETGGLKLASTITPVLQANRLTKCASHPKKSSLIMKCSTEFNWIGSFSLIS